MYVATLHIIETTRNMAKLLRSVSCQSRNDSNGTQVQLSRVTQVEASGKARRKPNTSSASASLLSSGLPTAQSQQYLDVQECTLKFSAASSQDSW